MIQERLKICVGLTVIAHMNECRSFDFYNLLNSAKLNPLCQFTSFAFPLPYYITCSVQPLHVKSSVTTLIVAQFLKINIYRYRTFVCIRDMTCIVYFLCEINWLNIWFVVSRDDYIWPYIKRQEQVISRYILVFYFVYCMYV